MIDQATLKSIEDLHRLKTDGIITDEEFERSKEKLLFGNKPAAAAAPKTGIAAAVGIIGSGAPATLPPVNDRAAWIMLPLRRYADFTGRSCRREFWMFQLVYVALGVLFMIAILDTTGPFGTASTLAKAVGAGCVVALLALCVPLLAVQARRFHDQDRSGWLVLINFVPYVGAIIVYVMMLLEGTPGENRYGLDPRQA